MRETCQVMLPGGICGKPAVDYLDDGPEERFWLCAEHYDEFGEIGSYPEDLADDFEDF